MEFAQGLLGIVFPILVMVVFMKVMERLMGDDKSITWRSYLLPAIIVLLGYACWEIHQIHKLLEMRLPVQSVLTPKQV